MIISKNEIFKYSNRFIVIPLINVQKVQNKVVGAATKQPHYKTADTRSVISRGRLDYLDLKLDTYAKANVAIL